MKTEEILLAIGLAGGAWYLLSKKTEAQQLPQIISGGGGGGGFDLSSLLAGLSLGNLGGGGYSLPQFQMPSLSLNLGDLGLGGAGAGGFDVNAFMSSLADMFKGVGGAGAGGGQNVIDKLKTTINDTTKSWTEPWQGITDPLHQANVNLANIGHDITEGIGTVTAVGRTITGGVTNAFTFQSPWWSYLLGPAGAVIAGMSKEAGQITSEKFQAAVNANLGPAALAVQARYSSDEAMHAAAAALVEKLKPQGGAGGSAGIVTPQHQAMNDEVNKGKTPEGPSGLYTDNWAKTQPPAVQNAQIIDNWQRLTNYKGNKIGYA